MSIRSEAMPYRGELSFQLQDLLQRNGMRAQLAVEQDKYKLLVQGHAPPHYWDTPSVNSSFGISLTEAPTMPTRKPIRHSTALLEKTLIYLHPMSLQGMLTDVLPWDFMAIGKDIMTVTTVYLPMPLAGIS